MVETSSLGLPGRRLLTLRISGRTSVASQKTLTVRVTVGGARLSGPTRGQNYLP